MDTAIIKAAKKALKKHDSSSIKLKTLAKKVVEKLESSTSTSEHEDLNEKKVRKIIEQHDLFTIDGKLVSMANSSSNSKGGDGKRKLSPDGNASPKKSSKKSKKSSKHEKQPVPPTTTTAVSISDSNIPAWRTERKIVLKGTSEDIQKDKDINSNPDFFPFSSFDSPKCQAKIASALLHQCTVVNKFTTPSPIQAQCWPVLCTNTDVVGIAETGSGKTLAFAIPALTHMYEQDSSSQTSTRTKKKQQLPRMLVLAPTRELAMQSHQVLLEFGATVNLKSLVVYGGVPKKEQRNALRRGVDCIVATPGRLKDLIQEGTCDLSSVSNLVLDEADRMLDMGFEEDVRSIISCCQDRDHRQTAMFSATWPASIQKIAMEYMVTPVRIYVGFEAIVGSNGENNIDDSLSANKRVSQTVEVIEDRAREARLRQLLQKFHKKRDNRVLIFALYKKEAQRLENNLRREGWKCCSIHGDKGQEARTKALEDFKNGSNPLMIATDVAARGLDIPNVEVVLNYTFPLTIEDYVHRIGRTGRAGKTGISYTFFQPGDKSHAGELQQVMRQAGQDIPEALMAFGSTIKKKEHKLYGNFGPKSGPMKKATKIVFGDDY